MSEQLKLTQAVVRGLESTPGAQLEVRDAEQTGFGVRVGSSGRKVFFVLGRVNGRMIRSTVGKFPEMNVDDARKKARRMLIEMADGVNPNDAKKERSLGRLTLGGVFESYMSTRKELSETTRAGYLGVYGRSLALWKTRHISEITSAMVIEQHINIGENRGKNVANQAMRLLRAVMNFSRSSNGIPKENPCAVMSEVKAWYKDGVRSNIISRAAMPKFFAEVAALSNETGRDYLMLLLFTGLRRNEGMALRWENVDFVEVTLTVTDTKTTDSHTIPMPAYIVALLYARQQRWGDEGFVFPTQSKTGHLVSVQHILVELRGRGLNFALHDLRRTFITVAESLDISTYAVKRLANHAQTDVTGKHYVIHDIDRLREPMDRVAAAILKMGECRAIPPIVE